MLGHPLDITAVRKDSTWVVKVVARNFANVISARAIRTKDDVTKFYTLGHSPEKSTSKPCTYVGFVRMI
jgi:hypothetical protein